MKPMLLFNGSIQVCDDAGSRVEALGVADGRIVAAGSADEVRRTLDPDHDVIDLAGRAVLPGLIDAHNHHALGGRAVLYETHVPPTATFDETLEFIRQAAASTPPGQWIIGGAFDIGLEHRLATPEALRALDAASGDHPVSLRDLSYHNRWVNTAAMTRAGIDADTPDPQSGTIVRDPASGAPTGFLQEAACALVDAVMEAEMFDEAANRRISRKAIEILHSLGVTAIQDPLTTAPMAEALAALDRSGELDLWVVASLIATEAPIYVPAPTGVDLFAIKERFRTHHVRPDFAKCLLDGVPMTGTAAMLKPYKESAGFGCCWRGTSFFTLPQFSRILADIERAGLSAKIHCTGDAATQLALDAIEVLRDFNGPSTARHQIAHASIIWPEEIARMKRLGVTAEMSPMVWFPNIFSGAATQLLSEEVLDRAYPIAEFLDAGLLIAGGSDWPVMPSPDLWIGIEGMVTRRDPTGATPGAHKPEQAVPAIEAVRAFTLYAARAIGLEHEIGSLEVGKSADFIILDQDPVTCAPDDIADTKVLSTWFEGRKVYER